MAVGVGGYMMLWCWMLVCVGMIFDLFVVVCLCSCCGLGFTNPVMVGY